MVVATANYNSGYYKNYDYAKLRYYGLQNHLKKHHFTSNRKAEDFHARNEIMNRNRSASNVVAECKGGLYALPDFWKVLST